MYEQKHCSYISSKFIQLWYLTRWIVFAFFLIRVRWRSFCSCGAKGKTVLLQRQWEQSKCLARYIVHFVHVYKYIIMHLCWFIFKHKDGIPLDGSPVDVILATSAIVAGLIYALSFPAISFTLICLGFNIIFRKRKWA